MLRLALVSLLMGLAAAVVGFSGLTGQPAFAQFLALLFLALFGIFFILGSPGARSAL
jgi:uncharacterized membrane protein YtjA (UPF0391 family)